MTKIDRVFSELMKGKSFNRFEAERQLHDHCLHTSVSILEKKHRIVISRRREKVPCYGGTTTVCRYWIDIKERERIISRRKQAKKEATHCTDQDKESGLLNIDSLAKKPTS